MSGRVAAGERRRFLLVWLVALALYAPTVRHRNLKDCGGSSRMATIESLVERSTFAIDGSTFAYSCDRMAIDGRHYSDKPPLLSVAAAGLYALLHHGLGLSFEPAADPHVNHRHDHTYALMTLLVVTLAQALLVALFDRAAFELGLAASRRLAATLGAAFATLLWPLSATFNPHPVAALLLLAGLRWLLVASPPRPALAGLALGLLAGVDIPLGALALALGLGLGAGPGRLRFAAFALGPLALHGALNVAVVGDLVPFQMHRELYSAATGHAGESATGFAQDAGLLFYAARNLVGSLGVFALTPVAAPALVLCLRAASVPGRARRLALLDAALFLAVSTLYVAVWPEAVGCSYGMRHVAPILPPLLLAAAAVAGRGAFRLLVVLGALSAVLAGGGLLSPATCAGFVNDRRGLVPARTFLENLRDELGPRTGGRDGR